MGTYQNYLMRRFQWALVSHGENKVNYKLLKGHNDPFTKNLTQYSYSGI